MHILQLVDSFNIGGAEVVAMNIAEGLQSRGESCALCAIGRDGDIAEHLKKKEIKSYCLNRPYGFSLKIIGTIAKIIWHEQTDVVVTHHFRQLIHACFPAKILGKKLIHIEHDYHFYEDKPAILKRLSFLLKFVDSFICVSSEIVDWFTDNIPGISSKSHYINNGVDTERFRPDSCKRSSRRNHYGIKPGSFVIGTCARLEPIKNIELLLNGFAEFQKNFFETTLFVIGEGSQMQNLQQQAMLLKVEEHVIFTGIQNEVDKFLPMFDAYVITSHDEGMPLSVLEAMSTGLPIIATPVGALPLLINEQTGILLQGHDRSLLSLALLALSNNREQSARKGRNGRAFVNDHFSLDSMINRYVEVINTIGVFISKCTK
jgi:glycosyltransferase involved in cell wall biosynthesis